jgi:hypothetical protein
MRAWQDSANTYMQLPGWQIWHVTKLHPPRHVPHHSSSRHTRQGNHLDSWKHPVEWHSVRLMPPLSSNAGKPSDVPESLQRLPTHLGRWRADAIATSRLTVLWTNEDGFPATETEQGEGSNRLGDEPAANLQENIETTGPTHSRARIAVAVNKTGGWRAGRDATHAVWVFLIN